MLLNFKQQELIEKLLQQVRKRFPEVQLINVTPSPENPDDIWINVTSPADEDREIALIEFGARKTTDILVDYGYHMLMIPSGKPEDNGLGQKLESLPIVGS